MSVLGVSTLLYILLSIMYYRCVINYEKKIGTAIQVKLQQFNDISNESLTLDKWEYTICYQYPETVDDMRYRYIAI